MNRVDPACTDKVPGIGVNYSRCVVVDVGNIGYVIGDIGCVGCFVDDGSRRPQWQLCC